MTSYLRNWLYSGTSSAEPETPPVPTFQTFSPPASDDGEGEDTETEQQDDDTPPAFPSLNSAQRVQSAKMPGFLSDSERMPPPPVPSLSVRRPGVPNPPSSGSSLLVPTTTTKPPPKPSKKAGGKVALSPGHSPLDWAALKSSGADLRGVDSLMRIPPSVLKKHNKRDDAWSAFNGKVYNMTAYLPFHPGGERELMRVAGRDGTQLFASTHAWVNVDFMLDSCLVGFLVPEPPSP
ncbi:Cytochrome b5 reductase 4 [Psilocybe cubensis]|uniref:Cytochrome b5 heme-binding domain-containing protein n=2 Tax=Psilocybe cubensis TaxID=181762 RepID=A0A8H8CLR5_PSICU|nr:Cytochrome b5 reductase 4 [Psilocybe cubensis]KAH9481279.1 Cytochrome b5 reductase 4 [Psilocybe cubensis]